MRCHIKRISPACNNYQFTTINERTNVQFVLFVFDVCSTERRTRYVSLFSAGFLPMRVERFSLFSAVVRPNLVLWV